jgi:hypothetical protein
MRKRTWISLAVVAVAIAAFIAIVLVRKNAPPEVARLLPEADAVVYFNLKPLRTLTHFDRHPVAHDSDYQAFIDATGIQFERDLDQAAFAVHRMADPNGPNGPVAYSEVFQGHFDGERLTAYLASQGKLAGNYAGHDIYAIAHDGRTVRVTILGYDLVAVSNTPTPEQIHSMIDRYHTAASPFSGNTLLSRYYSKVPLLSEVWGIGALGLPLAEHGRMQVMGLPLPLSPDAIWIGSARYLGAVHLRLEELAATPAEARQTTELLRLALKLLRATTITPDGQTAPDATAQAWNTVLANTTVIQKDSRAILKATVPADVVKSLLAKPAAATTPAQP